MDLDMTNNKKPDYGTDLAVPDKRRHTKLYRNLIGLARYYGTSGGMLLFFC